MGKAAGTGARELTTGGSGGPEDEGRSRDGAVKMVRRSRRRRLQKFTGLCRQEEGLRVRGWEGEAREGQEDGSKRSGEGFFGAGEPRNTADREGCPMDLERKIGRFEGTEP